MGVPLRLVRRTRMPSKCTRQDTGYVRRVATDVLKLEGAYQTSHTLVERRLLKTPLVRAYLVGDPLVLEGLEELALLQGGEQTLLVAELEEYVGPVADERRPTCAVPTRLCL